MRTKHWDVRAGASSGNLVQSRRLYCVVERGRTLFDNGYRNGACDHGEHAVIVPMDLVRMLGERRHHSDARQLRRFLGSESLRIQARASSSVHLHHINKS